MHAKLCQYQMETFQALSSNFGDNASIFIEDRKGHNSDRKGHNSVLLF